jgi:hypothetical protein
VPTDTLIADEAGNPLSSSPAASFVVSPPPVPQVPPVKVIVGTDAGSRTQVQVFDGKTGQQLQVLTPFGDTFSGGARVALGDLNGDRVEDIVVAAGPGGGPQVVVYNGADGSLLSSFLAFEETFSGGVFVSLGDFDDDGQLDIVTSPDQGGGPRVRIVNLANLEPLADFFAIDDVNFRGGVRSTVGDVNNDGVADLTVAAGMGGGPRIAIFDGRTVAAQNEFSESGRLRLVNDFFAFEDSLRNGAFVAVGDIDGDGFGDLVLAAGPGGGPRVTILSGRDLLAGEPTPIADFFASTASSRAGVRVAVKAIDSDSMLDVLVGDGAGEGSSTRVFLSKDLRAGITTPSQLFTPFEDALGGVFVG